MRKEKWMVSFKNKIMIILLSIAVVFAMMPIMAASYADTNNTKGMNYYSYNVSIRVTDGTYSGNVVASSGDDYSCTISANVKYNLPKSVTITVAGTQLTTDKYTYDSTTGAITIAGANVTGDIIITANCPIKTYKVAASSSAGGSVTGAKTVNYGGSVTLKAKAKSGYYFVKWTKNGKAVSTKSTLTVSNVTANCTYKAVFKKVITKFTLKLKGNKIVVHWKAVKGAAKYQIAYNTTKNGKIKIMWTGKNSLHEYTKIHNAKGVTFKFKMRYYKIKSGKKVYSAWTSIKTITR